MYYVKMRALAYRIRGMHNITLCLHVYYSRSMDNIMHIIHTVYTMPTLLVVLLLVILLARVRVCIRARTSYYA